MPPPDDMVVQVGPYRLDAPVHECFPFYKLMLRQYLPGGGPCCARLPDGHARGRRRSPAGDPWAVLRRSSNRLPDVPGGGRVPDLRRGRPGSRARDRSRCRSPRLPRGGAICRAPHQRRGVRAGARRAGVAATGGHWIQRGLSHHRGEVLKRCHPSQSVRRRLSRQPHCRQPHRSRLRGPGPEAPGGPARQDSSCIPSTRRRAARRLKRLLSLAQWEVRFD